MLRLNVHLQKWSFLCYIYSTTRHNYHVISILNQFNVISSTKYDGKVGKIANMKSAVSEVKWVASRAGRFFL